MKTTSGTTSTKVALTVCTTFTFNPRFATGLSSICRFGWRRTLSLWWASGSTLEHTCWWSICMDSQLKAQLTPGLWYGAASHTWSILPWTTLTESKPEELEVDLPSVCCSIMVSTLAPLSSAILCVSALSRSEVVGRPCCAWWWAQSHFTT